MPSASASSEPLPPRLRLRSGTAARLAGLPVTTLRVWERRYGVVAAQKTDAGQRLYSSHDVSRLRLMRQLTLSGHAIGTLAALELEALQSLAAGLPTAPAESGTGIRRAVVIGRSAAHKLEAVAPCEVLAVFEDLDQAETQPASTRDVDLLLVRLASLQPPAVARVMALAARWRASAVVVLYAFGAEPTAASLRALGALVRREPTTSRELAQLIRDAQPAAVPSGAWQVMPRRFDDEALVHLAESPSPIACECLRHIAEIVMQLAGFERYSEDCVSRGPADAALHRHLSHLAGGARSAFEQALQRVVEDAGLALPNPPRGQSGPG
jgi:MerR family transcriptional regulator, light-induced transcriptional regulator